MQGSGAANLTTNAKVSAKYQSGLRQHMRAHADVYGDLGVHALRSVYARLVFELFSCGSWTPDAVTMRVCGHMNPLEAMSYSAVLLPAGLPDGLRGCLGSLTLSDDEG